MITIITIFLFSIAVGVTAVVYSIICTMPGMIFSKWLQYALNRFPVWLHKPLISCQNCVAGQMGFWLYIYLCIKTDFSYDLPAHLWFASQCIFNAFVISHFISKLYELPKSAPYVKHQDSWSPPEIINQNTTHAGTKIN